MEYCPAWLVVLLVLSLALVTGCQTMTHVDPVYGLTNPTPDETPAARPHPRASCSTITNIPSSTVNSQPRNI